MPNIFTQGIRIVGMTFNAIMDLPMKSGSVASLRTPDGHRYGSARCIGKADANPKYHEKTAYSDPRRVTGTDTHERVAANQYTFVVEQSEGADLSGCMESAPTGEWHSPYC